uniref:ENTH domain-containing protein n=1 Tax=Davidia involucrata TaxID=16924 RepID=A0A5B7AFE1_DAVIN
MGRIRKLRDLIGVIKDKASLSKAAIVSKPNTLSLYLAVLRATTHSPSTPPDDRHLTTLLSLGDSSRATASAIVESLMDRLHRTSDSSVALKCLLTIHHIIKRGPFILQDQLSIFPAGGGRNYLNLSAFRDGATAATWALSAFVRWYARYLETLLSTSRVLGFFLCSISCTVEKEKQDERVSSFMNIDLIRDVDSVVAVIEEICKVPDSLHVEGNKFLDEVMGLVGGDFLSAVEEISLRLGEFKERLSCLSYRESVELMSGLKRLEECKERLMGLFCIKKGSTETLWGLIGELKDRVGMVEAYRESQLVNMGRRERTSESARLEERVLKPGDHSVLFSSARFDSNKFSFVIRESTKITS